MVTGRCRVLCSVFDERWRPRVVLPQKPEGFPRAIPLLTTPTGVFPTCRRYSSLNLSFLNLPISTRLYILSPLFPNSNRPVVVALRTGGGTYRGARRHPRGRVLRHRGHSGARPPPTRPRARTCHPRPCVGDSPDRGTTPTPLPPLRGLRRPRVALTLTPAWSRRSSGREGGVA